MTLISKAFIVSTVLIATPTFSNTEEKATTQFENQTVSTAYGNLKKKMLILQTENLEKDDTVENKHKLFVLSNNLNKVPVVPLDEELQALKLSKPDSNDPKVWAEFYTLLANAYSQESTRAHETANQAFARGRHTKHEYKLDAMRLDNNHRTLGTQRSKGESSDSFKSAQHLPSETHRNAISYHSRSYREALAAVGDYRFKADFYGQLAEALNPTPEICAKTSQH